MVKKVAHWPYMGACATTLEANETKAAKQANEDLIVNLWRRLGSGDAHDATVVFISSAGLAFVAKDHDAVHEVPSRLNQGN